MRCCQYGVSKLDKVKECNLIGWELQPIKEGARELLDLEDLQNENKVQIVHLEPQRQEERNYNKYIEEEG